MGRTPESDSTPSVAGINQSGHAAMPGNPRHGSLPRGASFPVSSVLIRLRCHDQQTCWTIPHWLRCMMNPLHSPPERFAAHAALTSPRSICNQPSPPNERSMIRTSTLLGWFVDSYHGKLIMWHTGGWVGFGSVTGLHTARVIRAS